MKICWFGFYDPEYSRNSVLINGLRRGGEEVVECQVKSEGLLSYFVLIKKLILLKNDYDVLFCAFPLNLRVLLAAKMQLKPIVIDAFFPMYDAVVNDRKVHSKYSLYGLIYYLTDSATFVVADEVITDTGQHKEFWQNKFKEKQISVIPVGVNEDQFFIDENKAKINKKIIVTYHGNYIPLHGVDKIVEAISILKSQGYNQDMHFRFIGKGQELKMVEKKIAEENLYIEMIPWLPIKSLNKLLNETDIILGVFGDTEKTDRVIPNKLFHGVVLKKPVITKDTRAVRELFNNDEILLINNSPKDIAKAIKCLVRSEDERTRISRNAYQKFSRKLTSRDISKKLIKVFDRLV